MSGEIARDYLTQVQHVIHLSSRKKDWESERENRECRVELFLGTGHAVVPAL